MSDLIERLKHGIAYLPRTALEGDPIVAEFFALGDTITVNEGDLYGALMTMEAAANALSSKDAEIEALRTRAESAEALLAEAGKALEPFATYAENNGFGLNHLGNPLPDEDGVGWVYLNNGNFRLARSTLSKIGDRT